MHNYDELSAKDLKKIADDAGIEYAKNASKKTMLSLLKAYHEGSEDQKEGEVSVEEIAEVLEVAEQIVDQIQEEESKKKVYGGICLRTGKALYLQTSINKETAMAINSIKHLESINGKKIIHMDKLREEYPEHFNAESGQMDYKWFEKEIRPNHHIYVRHDVDSLTFNMLTKPASEGGDLTD